jgi:AraC-like DNA-binding protein
MERVTSEPELSARLVWPFLRLLRDRGVPVGSLAIHGRSLEDPDARISHRLALSLLALIDSAALDEALGLHAAERVEQGDFDVLEYAAMSSSTLGEGIATANRYLRLIHDAAEFTLETDGSTALWRFELSPTLVLPATAAEYFMAIFAIRAQGYAGRSDLLAGVHFSHVAPRDVREHQRIFRAPLHFGHTHNALVMPASALDLPLVKSDPALKTLLARMADEMLERLPKIDSLVAHVRRLLAAELRGGDPGIEHLAKKLHTTSRTLRRRLQEAGTTHREILDELRKELAFKYLGERSLGTRETAFLLGYATASPFAKAFRRWAGISASEYRRNRRAKR